MIKLDRESLEDVIDVYVSKNIIPEFLPDIIIGIKTAGDIVGKIVHKSYLMNEFNPQYESIKFQRSTTNFKDRYLRNVLEKLPVKVLNVLRKIEFKLYIKFSEADKNTFSIKKSNGSGKKILLVDDSVDTGRTLVKAKNYLLEKYKDADIRVFSVAQTTNEPLDSPDYLIYNEMIIGPWSIDFKEKK